MTRQLLFRLLCVTCLLPALASAASISALVKDHNGEPLEDAVITVHPKNGAPVKLHPGKRIIDQIDKEYVPHVLVVERGSPVYFPNKDDIRHHVYSFSAPKKFELPLYKGTPAKPVLFDKAGVVKLGCNIHDWMLGYIYVVETPYFGKSGSDGAAKVTNLPAGEYTVTVWHPRMKGKTDKTAKIVKLAASNEARLDFSLKVRKEFLMRRAPRAGGRKY